MMPLILYGNKGKNNRSFAGGMQKSYAENTKKLDDNSSSFEVTDPGIEPGIQPSEGYVLTA